MTPGIEDGLAFTFYFVFWGAICWMLEYTLANVFQVMGFSWVVVSICGALLSYGTIWVNKSLG